MVLQGSPSSLASLSDMPEPLNEVRTSIFSYCLLTLARGELLLSLILPQAHTVSLASAAHRHPFLLRLFSPCPPGGPSGAPGAICLPTCNTKGCCGFGGRDLPERTEQAVLGGRQLWVLQTHKESR